MNSYFYKFMINLLKRFSSERKLLEMRGAFIIRSEHPTSLAEAPEPRPAWGGDGDDGVEQPEHRAPSEPKPSLKPPVLAGRRFQSKRGLPFACPGTVFLAPVPRGKVAPCYRALSEPVSLGNS